MHLDGIKGGWFMSSSNLKFLCDRWFHGENCDIEKHLNRINLALLEGKENDLYYDDEPSHYWASIRQFFQSLRYILMNNTKDKNIETFFYWG